MNRIGKGVAHVIAAIATALAAGGAMACNYQPEFDDAGGAMLVQQPTFNWGAGERGAVITALGTVKNTSGACAENIVVEVRFFDEQKNVVDVVTKPLDSIVLPPTREVAFRVQAPAAQPKAMYASMSARVVSADQRYSSRPPPSSTLTARLLELLAGWGPMLLLIAVWLFFMRRFSGRNSPQHRTLDLWAQQIELQRENLAEMRRLADSVQKLVER